MSKNKEGFEVGASIESDDLLTHLAKMRQKPAQAAKITDKDKFAAFLSNELAMQKVRLKPLGLDALSQAITAYFAPVKKAPVKKD